MRYDELSELYDAENASHAMLREDVPFFLGQLQRRRQRILEIGVGTGRCALLLAGAGHAVVGIDHDPRMIALATRKQEAAGLTERQLSLRVADVRRLRLSRRFDWAVCFFNTFLAFTTLAEQDAFLQSAWRSLRPGGRLWLDILAPNVELLAQSRSEGLEPLLFHAPSLGGSVLKTIDVKRDLAKQVEHVTFNYRWCDPFGRERLRRMRFDMTFLFPRELELLLNRNRFDVEYLWGNYDGSPPTSASPRLIVRARKRKDR